MEKTAKLTDLRSVYLVLREVNGRLETLEQATDDATHIWEVQEHVRQAVDALWLEIERVVVIDYSARTGTPFPADQPQAIEPAEERRGPLFYDQNQGDDETHDLRPD